MVLASAMLAVDTNHHKGPNTARASSLIGLQVRSKDQGAGSPLLHPVIPCVCSSTELFLRPLKILVQSTPGSQDTLAMSGLVNAVPVPWKARLLIGFLLLLMASVVHLICADGHGSCHALYAQ